MRGLAIALAVVAVLAAAVPARGDAVTRKARAMIIAGSVMTALGVASTAAGFGILGDCMSATYGCEDTGLLFVPLLTVGAGHFLIGLPLLIVGMAKLSALRRPPAAPAAASPLFY